MGERSQNHLEKDGLLKELDHTLEHIEKAMDKHYMFTGKAVAELFRAACTAAAKLPNMELYTELMEVHSSDEELTVIFHRAAAEAGMRDGSDEDGGSDDDGYENYKDCDEEEEEMLYDGD